MNSKAYYSVTALNYSATTMKLVGNVFRYESDLCSNLNSCGSGKW